MNDTDLERELLRDLLAELLKRGEFPERTPFRVRHKQHRETLDRLEAVGFLTHVEKRYELTPEGLVACGSDESRRLIAARNELIPFLLDLYREEPNARWTVPFIAENTGYSETEVSRALTFLEREPSHSVGWVFPGAFDEDDVPHIEINKGIEEAAPLREAPAERPAETPPTTTEPFRLSAIQVSGYRPLQGFSAAPGALTVIIGANSTGKSSLFDFLRFVSFAVQAPIPPEIDARCVGRTLFHAGGDERLSFALEARNGAPSLVRYEGEIQGPVGSVRVVRERMQVLSDDGKDAPILLDFRGGKGSVRDPAVAVHGALAWNVPQNELALRRVLDPRLVTLSRFQGFVASWRFYTGFDISPAAALRRPAHVEASPILAEDGANLSAVLHSILLEHRQGWDEMETSLRGAVPGFSALNVRPRGGKGMVMGTWREEGIAEELTLADLSDGTLRLLGWLALAFSPSLPPLICIDEPEIGLHPRVLPVLAGALKLASARTQILVATHSPHFLSQFDLSDIAVMRKTEGRAVFVRPETSEALRNEVAEMGGEAIARLFLSEELEVLP